MCKLLVVGTLVAGALAFIPWTSARALVPVQADIAGIAAINDVIQVKRHKHGAAAWLEPRPQGRLARPRQASGPALKFRALNSARRA